MNKPKPKISDFQNPADFAAACVKYAEGLTSGDPGDDGARADEGDTDAESVDREDAAPVMGSDPSAFIAACEARAKRRGVSIAEPAASHDGGGGARQDSAEPAYRYSEGGLLGEPLWR